MHFNGTEKDFVCRLCWTRNFRVYKLQKGESTIRSYGNFSSWLYSMSYSLIVISWKGWNGFVQTLKDFLNFPSSFEKISSTHCLLFSAQFRAMFMFLSPLLKHSRTHPRSFPTFPANHKNNRTRLLRINYDLFSLRYRLEVTLWSYL